MSRLICLLALLPGFAAADPAEIVEVRLMPAGATWTVSVTLRHGDTGWDDYADGWRVLDAGGRVLGTRELLHPHVTEQPFTRSLSGVAIDPALPEVWIEARTSTGGWEGDLYRVAVPGR